MHLFTIALLGVLMSPTAHYTQTRGSETTHAPGSNSLKFEFLQDLNEEDVGDVVLG